MNVRIALSERVFALAVRAFPRRLRADVGPEMIATFRSALAERWRSGRPLAGFTVRAIADVIGTGMAERRLRRSGFRRGDGGMREFLADVRLAARRLRRAPGFALAALAMLAVGIGATTAVFSALKAVMLAEPPFPAPERLVVIELELGESAAAAAAMPWSFRKFGVLEEGSGNVFEQLAGYGARVVALSGGDADPRRLTVEVVAGPYFETLGVTPSVGRAFAAAETGPAEAPAAIILGHSLWRERYGGDAGVVGRTVEINDQPVEVVGVAPAGFAGLSGAADAWLPAPTAGQVISPVMIRSTHAHWLLGIGRLAEGVAAGTAADRLAGVASTVAETYPLEGMGAHTAVRVTPLGEARRNAQSRTAVGVLMVASVMVLLIACANLAGLLLARARGRSRDAAIRLALGAGRVRVARAALAESLVLATAGGAAGLLLARWGIAGLRAAWPQRFLSPEGRLLRAVDLDLLRLDAAAVAFALLATLLTVLLFGLLPALRTASVAPQETLRSRGGRPGRRRARSVLVAAQTALALTLLVGSGLLFESLHRLRAVDTGIEANGLVAMHLTVSRGHPAADAPVPLREAIVEGVSGLPGVESATLGCAPLKGGCWEGGITHVDGREADVGTGIGINMVPDGYFETLRIPVLSGRAFAATDRAGGPPVVVISRQAALRIFGEENPLGRTLAVTADVTADRPAEVIGVVGDVLRGRPDEGHRPEAYFSERQMAEADADLLVRTPGEPLAQVQAVRSAIRAIDPSLVVDNVRTMESAHGTALGDTRILLALLGLFASAALALTAAGLWATVALTVEERRPELGLRMALGARAGTLMRMVMREGLLAALAGALIGAWAAWGLARLLSSLLFQTDTGDPKAFAGALAVLLAGAALACLLPARRATRVDPARTLRADGR